MAKWTLTLFLCSWQVFPSITWKDWIIIRWLHVTEAVLIFINRLIETVGKTTFFGIRHFLVSVLAKLDALKYGQWVPGLIKQCRIGLYMWCIVEAFIVFFFNVVHITLYSTVLKRVTLQAKWVQSRTAVMKIDIMNQIGQRSEYHCAVNTADGKAKDLRWMLILSSWLEWQHLLNNPERQKFRRLKDKQWIRQERGIRSPNSPSP